MFFAMRSVLSLPQERTTDPLLLTFRYPHAGCEIIMSEMQSRWCFRSPTGFAALLRKVRYRRPINLAFNMASEK